MAGSQFLCSDTRTSTGVRIGLCAAILWSLVGCSQFQQLSQTSDPIQSALAEPQPHLARLILIRPKESFFPFPERNPVQLYNGSEKIADIPQGQFLRLDSPALPKNLTVHWFDQENPKISRTINLTIHLEPGEVQSIELKHEEDVLMAQLIDEEQSANKLQWYAEVQKPMDFSESYVSLEPKTTGK